MKQIKMQALTVGDVYAHKIKMRNREAFEVVEVLPNDRLLIVSRNDVTRRTKTITATGEVTLLRNINDKK